MANRPTNSRDWAESADKSDVTNPTGERPRGYVRGETLPHDQFNWLLRELFRWVDYFDEEFQRAKEAVDLITSVLAGDHGEFMLVTDDSDVIRVRFQHTDDPNTDRAEWIADALTALGKVSTNVFLPTAGDEFTFQNGNAKDGKGGVELKYFRQGVSAALKVLAPGTGTSLGDLKLSKLLLDDIRQNSSSPIDVQDGSGNSYQGQFLTQTTPVTVAHVSIDNGSIVAVDEAGNGYLTNARFNGFFVEFDLQGPAARKKVQGFAQLELLSSSLIKLSVKAFDTNNDGVFDNITIKGRDSSGSSVDLRNVIREFGLQVYAWTP